MRVRLLAACLVMGCSPAAGGGGGSGGGSGSGGGTGGGSGGSGEVSLTLEGAIEIAVKDSVCRGRDIDDDIIEPLFVNATSGALADRFSGRVSCAGSAATCEDYLVCFGIDPNEACDPDAGDFCVGGTTLKECRRLGDTKAFAETTDCTQDPHGNTSCMLSPPDWARCASGSCTEDQTRCEGNVRIECYDGVERRRDCALEGEVCVSTADGSRCASGQTCSDSACDGDDYVRCNEGYVSSRFDCSTIGPDYTCATSNDGAGCAAKTASQQCQDGTAKCEGSTAVYCLLGRWVNVDCAQFLNATCSISGDDDPHCVSNAWTP